MICIKFDQKTYILDFWGFFRFFKNLKNLGFFRSPGCSVSILSMQLAVSQQFVNVSSIRNYLQSKISDNRFSKHGNSICIYISSRSVGLGVIKCEW